MLSSTIIGVLIIYVIEYKKENKKEKNFFKILKKLRIKYIKDKRGKWKFLFFVYFSFILQKTILNRTFGANNNLELALTIPNILEISEDRNNIGAIENLIFFIPYTFFLFQSFSLKKFKDIKNTLILSFLTSLVIEVLQLLTTLGTFQLSDLLYNTLGGVIGYIIYRIINIKK